MKKKIDDYKNLIAIICSFAHLTLGFSGFGISHDLNLLEYLKNHQKEIKLSLEKLS